MEATMDVLKRIPRVFLKDYIFIALVLFYVFGPLGYLAQMCPTLWSLPVIFVISGLVWNLVGIRISRQCVGSENKAIFISGCDSGFGLELAKRMSKKGYLKPGLQKTLLLAIQDFDVKNFTRFDIFAGCLFPNGDGAETLRNIPNVSIINFDVTEHGTISEAVTKVTEQLERDGKVLWGVVANAGIASFGPLEWTPMEEIEKVFQVNVFGVTRTAKAFLPLLRKSQGRFVVTASLAGLVCFQQLIAYSMSKAAVRTLAEGLNREIGFKSGIHFSSIMPTFHATPMVENASTDEIDRKFQALSESEQQQFGLRLVDRYKREFRAALRFLVIKDMSTTLKSFDHALTSIRPRSYYICDRPLFQYLVWPFVQHLPIEIIDFFNSRILYLEWITGLFPNYFPKYK